MDKDRLSHVEQYKMLREETMHHLREADRTGFWAVTAAGAVYAWLFAYNVSLAAAWYLPSFIILFSGLRVLANNRRMMDVAKYLERIETMSFGDDNYLPGWERYLRTQVGHYRGFSPAIFAMIFWIGLLVGSFFVSFWLSP
mgnify:CR=1 FL=1